METLSSGSLCFPYTDELWKKWLSPLQLPLWKKRGRAEGTLLQAGKTKTQTSPLRGALDKTKLEEEKLQSCSSGKMSGNSWVGKDG